MNLRSPYDTRRQPDMCEAFALPPAALTVSFQEPGQIANGFTYRERFDFIGPSQDFEEHFSETHLP